MCRKEGTVLQRCPQTASHSAVSDVCFRLQGQRWQVDRSTYQGQVYLGESGSNVSPGLAAVGDKPVSIKSIVMITTEIKQPTWALLVNSADSSFWSACNVCESRDEYAEGGTLILMMFHQSVWSFFFFFSSPFFFLAVLLLGLQKLSVLVTHSSILLS